MSNVCRSAVLRLVLDAMSCRVTHECERTLLYLPMEVQSCLQKAMRRSACNALSLSTSGTTARKLSCART